VNNMELTKDQISSYSAAVLSVETVKEEVGFNNGQNTLTLTVKADVDTDQVKQLVEAIQADKRLQDSVAKQQQQILQLEQQVQMLNSRLSTAPVSSASELRKERNVIFEAISNLERIHLAAAERIDKEQGSIRQKTEILLKYAVVGMTETEVKGLVGEPFRKEKGDYNWYYGDVYVCFDEPLGRGDLRVRAIGRPAKRASFFDNCEDKLLR